MKKEYFSVAKDGFYGTYVKAKNPSSVALIMLLGDDCKDHLALTGIRWARKTWNVNCLTMAPEKKDYGHHNLPVERFEKAIAVLKEKGNMKIGIVGASTTAMLSLVVASYCHDISLVLAFSPCDFVMEGFIRDGLDGCKERPADGESSISYRGKPLPYLPYYYRHPDYWRVVMKEGKETHNMASSLGLFNESEKHHPLREEEKIKVENIYGSVFCFGAKDDCLWNTAKYIQRMTDRMKEKESKCDFHPYVYEHGTHFIFPESFVKQAILFPSLVVSLAFAEGKKHKKECRQTRMDVDLKVASAMKEWLSK